jgi:hypothetical protein
VRLPTQLAQSIDFIRNIGNFAASVVTAKPAIRGHFKTGHRDWAKTRLFYSPEGVAGKVARLTSSIKRFSIADGR